jgi:hypothetical protein
MKYFNPAKEGNKTSTGLVITKKRMAKATRRSIIHPLCRFLEDGTPFKL